MKHIFHIIKEEFSALDTSRRQLRNFGLIIGGITIFVFAVFGVLMRTDMDYLVLENHILDKKTQPKFNDTENWEKI